MSSQPPDEATATTEAPCVVDHALTETELTQDVRTLAALGNDTRYEALRLVAGSDGEICVCELQPSLGVSQGAVSQALSRLRTAGLVTRRKEGRWRYYETTLRAERLLKAIDEARSIGGDRRSDDRD